MDNAPAKIMLASSSLTALAWSVPKLTPSGRAIWRWRARSRSARGLGLGRLEFDGEVAGDPFVGAEDAFGGGEVLRLGHRGEGDGFAAQGGNAEGAQGGEAVAVAFLKAYADGDFAAVIIEPGQGTAAEGIADETGDDFGAGTADRRAVAVDDHAQLAGGGFLAFAEGEHAGNGEDAGFELPGELVEQCAVVALELEGEDFAALGFFGAVFAAEEQFNAGLLGKLLHDPVADLPGAEADVAVAVEPTFDAARLVGSGG
jgi:hypothetical protein